jgi:hypothetical protein
MSVGEHVRIDVTGRLSGKSKPATPGNTLVGDGTVAIERIAERCFSNLIAEVVRLSRTATNTKSFATKRQHFPA